MATQTELQQALAIKKANPNMTVRDAVSQVKQTAPIANAPIAWQPPAITPLPTETQAPEKTTAQLNQEQLLRNQAKVQGEILAWTRPEVWTTSENVIPPVETPNVAPTPTTPPVTTPTPTVTPTTPEVKTETKATTTPTPPVIPKTVDGIYNAIASGQVLTDDVLRTPQYKQAKQRFDAVGKFGAMTVQQLTDSIKQGQITTSASSALANNPNYQLARQKVDTENKNKMLNNVYSTFATGKELVIENPVESISDKLISKYWLDTNESRNLYQEIVKNNTDVVNYAKQLSDVNKQIADTTKIINDGYKEIRKNYGGKLSASQLIAYMWSRFRDATELLSSLNTTKDYLKADLETASDLAIGEYNASIKDMERSDTIRNALFSAELGLYTEGQKLKLQADFAKKQAYENINDPATAINNVMEEYKKLGIPFTTTLQSRLQEFAQSGLSLPDYLTQMTESIQASPAYKQYAEKKAWELSDIQKIQLQAQISERADIRNFGQQIQLAQMQGDITRANYLWQIQNDPEKQAKLLELQQKANENKSLYDMLGVNVGTYEGNRGYDLAGKKWDPVPAGGNWKVKSIIDANYTSSPYGNSVVMEDENGNTVRYSHLESIGVKPWDTLGFGDIVGTRGNTGNVLGKNGEKLTAEQLKAWRGSHVDVEIKDTNGRLLSQSEQVNYLKGKRPAMQLDANALSIANWVWDLSDLTPTDKKTILPQLEQIVNSRMTGDQWRDAIVKSALYKKDVSDSTLQKITDMQTVAFQLDWIQERLANQKVWPILGQIKKLNPYDTEAQVALAELAGITPKVARGIFWEVWVLTDTDIANYQKTLPNLTSTEEKNAFVVDVMRKLLAKWVMNTIETQARWQRNMSPFLDVYDKAKSSLNTSSTSKYE